MKFNNLNIIISLSFIFFFTSCIIVKNVEKEEEADVVENQALKPEIAMSDITLLSQQGDMLAFLPKDWFFIDVTADASADVFAMAVNPDYTLGAIFSSIRKNELTDGAYLTEGLIGLARLSFEKHKRKTAGAAAQNGDFSLIQNGILKFAKFEFTTGNNMFPVIAAVFKTEIDQYYEFSLMPMNITGKPIPDKQEREKIFRSIMAMIQY
jgi:hypothetical protein